MTKASDNEFPSVLLEEQASAPTTPATGFWRAYAKSDGLYVVDDAGTETGPFGTAGGGGSGPTLVPKTADEVVNTSSTLQDDDDLLLALGANEVWQFEAMIHFDSGTTPDFKFAFTVPAGATLKWSNLGLDTSSVWQGGQVITASGSSLASAGAGVGTPRVVWIVGTVANGATPGNLQFQWAQNTSNGSDTTVHENSVLICHQLV